METQYSNISRYDVIMEQLNFPILGTIHFYSWPGRSFIGGPYTVAIWRIKQLKT